MKNWLWAILIVAFVKPSFGQVDLNPNPGYKKLVDYIYRNLDTVILNDTITRTFSISAMLKGGKISNLRFSNTVPETMKSNLSKLQNISIDWNGITGIIKNPVKILIPIFLVKDGRAVQYIKDQDDFYYNIYSSLDQDLSGVTLNLKNTIIIRPIVIRKFIGPTFIDNFKVK